MKIYLGYMKKHQQHGSCTPEIQVITVPLAIIVDKKKKVTVIGNASKIVFPRNLDHYWYYFLCSNR